MPKEIKAPKAKRGKRLPKMLIDGAAQDELDKMGGARVFDAKRLVASGKMRGKDNEVRYDTAVPVELGVIREKHKASCGVTLWNGKHPDGSDGPLGCCTC